MKVTRLNIPKDKQKKPESPFNIVDHPELIGLCRGVIADGTINLAEAEYIHKWLSERSNLLDTWPAKRTVWPAEQGFTGWIALRD